MRRCKRTLATTLAFLLLLLVGAPTVLAQQNGNGDEEDGGRVVDPGDNPAQRRGQTTMKFLTISMDARATALGNAMTAEDRAASVSLLYNPAGMAYQEDFTHLSVGRTQWFANFNYDYATLSFAPAHGNYGVFGLSVVAGDYGDFTQTIRYDNDDGFLRTGTYSPSTIAVGGGYSRALTDRFSAGGHIRYVRQDLGESVNSLGEEGTDDDMVTQENSEGVMVADFGMLYRTGFRSLIFAASVRNFSQELEYAKRSVGLPLSLNIGLAMNVMDFAEWGPDHDFLLSVEAQRPRDYFTQGKVGGEYTFMNLLSLRAGYEYPHDEQGVSLGAGLELGISDLSVEANYAYTQFGRLGNVNRLSVQIGGF